MGDNFEVMRGTGNVFADFGEADAWARQFKAKLAAGIIATLNRRGLSERDAAKLAKVDPADLQRIRNADLSRFSLDRLVRVAYRLGRRVDISIIDADAAA